MNKEEPSLPNIVVSAIAVTGGLVIMVIIAAIAYLPNRPDTVARPGPTSEDRREMLREKRDRDQRELGEYGWINRAEGRVRLPIDRAVELTVEEIERRGSIEIEDFDDVEEDATAEPEAEQVEESEEPAGEAREDPEDVETEESDNEEAEERENG